MFEASMNFDLEHVEPFLKQLDTELGLHLPVAELVSMTGSTPVESEATKSISVTFGGNSVLLEYRVFMDDVAAPDLYFFTESQALAKAIDDQLSRFADKVGI
jgi:hypothetical protein